MCAPAANRAGAKAGLIDVALLCDFVAHAGDGELGDRLNDGEAYVFGDVIAWSAGCQVKIVLSFLGPPQRYRPTTCAFFRSAAFNLAIKVIECGKIFQVP